MRVAEKVTRNVGILRMELTGKRSRSLVESVVEEALVHQERPIPVSAEWRAKYALDELIRKVDEAIRDEEEAWKMYDSMRTDMVTVFPVGSPEYDIFVRIAADEMRHREELSRIRNTLTERR